MTDRELGRALVDEHDQSNHGTIEAMYEAIGKKARELLVIEQAGPVVFGINPRDDYAALRLTEAGYAEADPALVAQLDRIEKEQGYQSARSAACVAMLHGLVKREIRIEKKLDWLYTNRTLTFSNQKWPA